eukprot:TRINITY_DN67905_c0_g1_i1.p3 TRINITY_DN67905_c0_g1~~TRINITY_DN67905_c0_g1_i1.p3  ORF type:complete len:118 (-),score=23.84 TRINITY_DN67905_c0_g1_i1:86-439(-)
MGLGNSGEGKSYLLKLIKVNWRLKKKNIICLDPEHEYSTLTQNMKGTFIDLMQGDYVINVLEPKMFDDGTSDLTQSDSDYVQALSLIHISEPTRPLYISYAVFCLKKNRVYDLRRLK